jgi:hypothetical protein
LHEKVLPWLFSKVEAFLADDIKITQNTYEIVE